MLRRLLKTAQAQALYVTRSDRLLGSLSRCRYRPLIICHHRVVEDVRAHRDSIPAMLISRRTLEQQLDWLVRRFRLISLDDLSAHLDSPARGTAPVAAITFDDGYQDVYHNAFPLLKQKGIPAAVFVVTDLVGTSELHIHDRLYLALKTAFARWKCYRQLIRLLNSLGYRVPALERLTNSVPDPLRAMGLLFRSVPQADLLTIIGTLESLFEIESEDRKNFLVMSWEMVAEMDRTGVAVGSHGMSHCLLSKERSQKVLDELVRSREELQRRLGTRVQHLAYPDGQFNVAVVNAALAAGYRFAYTTCGHRQPEHPSLTIPRLHLWENSCLDILGNFSSAIMSCQVNGIFQYLAPCQQDHRAVELSRPAEEPETSVNTWRKVTAL